MQNNHKLILFGLIILNSICLFAQESSKRDTFKYYDCYNRQCRVDSIFTYRPAYRSTSTYEPEDSSSIMKSHSKAVVVMLNRYSDFRHFDTTYYFKKLDTLMANASRFENLMNLDITVPSRFYFKNLNQFKNLKDLRVFTDNGFAEFSGKFPNAKLVEDHTKSNHFFDFDLKKNNYCLKELRVNNARQIPPHLYRLKRIAVFSAQELNPDSSILDFYKCTNLVWGHLEFNTVISTLNRPAKRKPFRKLPKGISKMKRLYSLHLNGVEFLDDDSLPVEEIKSMRKFKILSAVHGGDNKISKKLYDELSKYIEVAGFQIID